MFPLTLCSTSSADGAHIALELISFILAPTHLTPSWSTDSRICIAGAVTLQFRLQLAFRCQSEQSRRDYLSFQSVYHIYRTLLLPIHTEMYAPGRDDLGCVSGIKITEMFAGLKQGFGLWPIRQLLAVTVIAYVHLVLQFL